MLAKSKKVTFVEQVAREQSEYFCDEITFSTGNICPSAMSIMVSTAAARSSLRLWRQVLKTLCSSHAGAHGVGLSQPTENGVFRTYEG